MNLNKNTIENLSAGLQKPLYNRAGVKPSIIHIGVGGFHRAHQAYYLDALLNEQLTDWAICGMGLKPYDEGMYKAMKQQDCLYTLLIKHPEGQLQPRVIGAITDFVFVPENYERALQQLADEQTKIVSLTITEGGYNFNTAGEFIIEDADVQWDVKNPFTPRTVFGLLTTALKIRRENNIQAFTLLSCDNIQHNGDVLKKMLLSYCGLVDTSLAAWINENVCFPNSMVDRITPVTTPQDKALLKEKFYLDDACPVVCEPFIQWVLEDTFSYGRPAWEKAGVQFVKDVTPYETMKLRLLNAGHSLLGILGMLYGYHTIDEAVGDDDLQELLRHFMDMEVTPTLEGIEGIDLNEYKKTLMGRFANPNIKDQLSRICSESSAKLPKFLLPTIREQLAGDGQPSHSIFILAAWCHLLELYEQEAYNYSFQDEMLDVLIKNARDSVQDDVMKFIKTEAVFGDLANDEHFVEIYMNSIEGIRKYGINNAVQTLLAQ